MGVGLKFLVPKRSGAASDGSTHVLHMVAPQGWPEVELAGKKEDLTKDVYKALKKAGLGKPTEGEGSNFIMAVGKVIQVPHHVIAPDGTWIPVLVLADPISDLPMKFAEFLWGIRAEPHFVRSPIAIYSTHPIPDIVAHYATADGSALFDSQMHLTYRWGKAPDQEDIRTIAFQVLRFFGLKVDTDIGGLATIDRVLDGLHWKDDAPAIEQTVLALGGLTGAILIGSIGGTWNARRPDASYPKLEVPIRGPVGGDLEVDIMGRIEGRIRHGGDGVEALYHEVEKRVLPH